MMRDYRDKLREVLDDIHGREGTTRYRIAKLSGISEQTLSNVMHKRRNLSMDALQKLLDSLGYDIQFLPRSEVSKVESRSQIPAN
jgi:transcriptional regulator with XRE-family HTH domain